ncbi:pur operon repressor [Bombilactobacillus bombi]|jgi:purine operon repressor|uniref:pur operon repressor n=1 Tax=Bombilactobacillus bombi TaxID=1303590 RepID=UPI000E58A7D3|nr:pur operon repressor [Bombilactobacillus bombi]AXX64040.1 pur operon repressor [Bombilactobacillus bombi]MCO6540962.1 pur operon repressor [Lactobacillus sp.]
MKIRRSERLVGMTHYLENQPYRLIPLPIFAKKYHAAKSSISEDITILKHAFLVNNIGYIETLPGAGGGVIFTPGINQETATHYLTELQQKLSDPQRILPGGYLYSSDIIGDATLLRKIGLLIATRYAGQKADAIMTVATKGIPIAQSVAYYLNIPYVIVRRESKVTEGPTLSVNYESGSSSRVEKMELSKRSLPQGAKVIAVDDFMKGGGTVSGMRNLVQEFAGELVGISVLVDSSTQQSNKDTNVTTLLNVQHLDAKVPALTVGLGNYLQVTDFSHFNG